MYLAKSVCPGVAICNAFVWENDPQQTSLSTKYLEISPPKEVARYKSALKQFEADTYMLIKRAGRESEHSHILRQHITIANDPMVCNRVIELIETESLTCEAAVAKAFEELSQVFLYAENEGTRARTVDLCDIKNRLIKILMGRSDNATKHMSDSCIIIAHELTPSDMMRIDREKVKGIIIEGGSIHSHMAIMARSMCIPTAILAEGLMDKVKCGDEVAINITESRAEIIVSPTKEDVVRLKVLMKSASVSEHPSEHDMLLRDNHIYANISTPIDLDAALSNGADGIGLFRSEFLFLGKDCAPDEDEQFEVYKKVAQAFDIKPVTIRTLDIGADKNTPYLEVKVQPNPALGLRGIRLCLENVELFKTQLRAILRASAYGNVRIMLPMITTLMELRKTKALIEEAKNELEQHDIPFNRGIPVGIMIETPSAAIMADKLAKECDFFSIGTNDLTQYIMSVDRFGGEFSHLFCVYQPAVMRTIHNVIKAGKNAGIKVCMCGEAAAERRMVRFALACGLDEFSVAARVVMDVKKFVNELTDDMLTDVAEKVLDMETKEQIIEYLGG